MHVSFGITCDRGGRKCGANLQVVFLLASFDRGGRDGWAISAGCQCSSEDIVQNLGLNVGEALEAGSGVDCLEGDVDVGVILSGGEGDGDEDVEFSSWGGDRNFKSRELLVVVELFACHGGARALVVPAGVGVVFIVAIDFASVPVGEEGSEGVEEDHERVKRSCVVGNGAVHSQDGGHLGAIQGRAALVVDESENDGALDGRGVGEAVDEEETIKFHFVLRAVDAVHCGDHDIEVVSVGVD